MTLAPWPVLRSEPVFRGAIFDVTRDVARSPRTDRARDFHVIHMADWLLVAAVTPDRRLVMVRQYRHGAREMSLELPGGLLEGGHEAPAHGVQRELLEETGYRADSVILLGVLRPQPALLANRVHCFFASGAREIERPAPDEGEDLEVVLVGAREVDAAIARGEIVNAMTVAALSLARIAGHI